jgi:uncharacterized membrane protein YebE (DUF533 family)
MSLQNILNQLLQSGSEQYQNAKQSGDLAKYGKGAAVGGVLALLLGSQRGRSVGGSVLKLGSMAAIGTLAWKVYQDYQAKQNPAATATATPAPTFAALPAPAMEDHSRAMLRAMIAAAKADGHMDERERGLVEAEMARHSTDASTQQWLQAELRKPVEPADVAAAAASPEMAAEIYLASVLVADDTSTMERAYLNALAHQLKLTPELQQALEAKARAV